MAAFSLELVQAVNDWQRGFNTEQKVKRIAALRTAAAQLGPQYRRVEGPCYRQIALDPQYVMQMGLRYRLDETVSSWTLRYDVAQHFKGGVTPKGTALLPVILRVLPDPASVIVNIAALYADPVFLRAVDGHQPQVAGFFDGVGRWRDSQAEVVLELDAVYLHEVYATGGHSSEPHEFLQMPAVQQALSNLTPQMRIDFERAFEQGQGGLGPRWLCGAPKDRVLREWVDNAERVAARDAARAPK